MSGGWLERSLAFDLSSSRVEFFDRPASRRALLGGRGYGVALVSEFGSPTLGPLDPLQPFVLAAGPLTGTAAPSSGRFAAVASSPLTGTIFDGNAGGRFGVRLRRAGLDALVLTGQAEVWSVLIVEGREGSNLEPSVKLVPLKELWPDVDPAAVELTSIRTAAGLRKALGPAFSLVFPSVAGRRGALLGSLRTDDHRNLGRGGLGAALSAKRVFAVAVAGTAEVPLADPSHFSFLVYEAQKQLSANPVTSRALPEFGTAVLVQLMNQAGAFPALNYRLSQWDGADAISGETLRSTLLSGRKGCFGCRTRCTGVVGRAGSEGPEYETLWALGADCGIDDLRAIQSANRWCGELGLDTISTGATIACAMEMAEEGRLGRRLRFGDADRMLELVREMGEGTGFGAELADGSARFAARYERPGLSMHVKGLELPGYDPRGMHGQGLAYATSNRGGCHLRANMVGPEILGIPKLIDRFATAGKAGILISLQHLSAVFDSACLCKFAGFAFGEEVLARLVSAATGDQVTSMDLLRMGERAWTLERLWNLAAGFERADDTLPERLLSEPSCSGPSSGQVVDLQPMLDEYYRARGWTTQGAPTPAKLLSLGLEPSLEGERRTPTKTGHPTNQGWRPEVARGQPGPSQAPGEPASGHDAGGKTPRRGARHLRAV